MCTTNTLQAQISLNIEWFPNSAAVSMYYCVRLSAWYLVIYIHSGTLNTTQAQISLHSEWFSNNAAVSM